MKTCKSNFSRVASPPIDARGQKQGSSALSASGDGIIQESLESGYGSTTPSEDCSWTEVLASMEAASDEHRAKVGEHRLRAVQRNKAVAVTLQSLTDMIPDQSGLSILRGGLKTIFKLLVTRIENGQRILAAFEDIPITFSEACHALMAYPDDEPLRRSVEGLYLTLRDVIPRLVEVLLHRHKGSLARRVFKQHPEHEAQVIDTALENVSRASRRVTTRVNTLASHIAVANLRETRNAVEGVFKARVGVEKLTDSIQSTQIEMERRYEQQEHKICAFVESINQNLQQRLSDCEGQFRLGFVGIQDSLHEMMRCNCSPRLLPTSTVGSHIGSNEPVQCSLYPTLPSHSGSVALSYDKLYMLLRISDPVFLAADLGIVLRASSSLGHKALGRATWLLKVDRFKFWARIDSGSSDLLLVNGHLGGNTQGKISPLSVFVATLASMPESPSFIVLTHFCGLHSSPRDRISGPRGMLRSLIAQLILIQRKDQTTTTVNIDEKLFLDIANHNLNALCMLFRALILQIREDLTIYCAIDNISEFETTLGGWNSELCEVVYLLQSIIVGQLELRTRGPRLRILLTAPGRSIRVYRQIAAEDCISLGAGHINSHSTKQTELTIKGSLEGLG